MILPQGYRRTLFLVQNCGQMLWISDYISQLQPDIAQVNISVIGSVDVISPEGHMRCLFKTNLIGQSTNPEGHANMVRWINEMAGYDQPISTAQAVAATPIGVLFGEFVREMNPQLHVASAVGTVLVIDVLVRLPVGFQEEGSSNDFGSA